MKLMHAMLFAVATLLATPVVAQKPAAGPTPSDMEILRQKIKADKKLVVAANMQLTEAEAKGFWPVYEGYQKELHAINERLGKLILAYAEAYNKGAVPNDTAATPGAVTPLPMRLEKSSPVPTATGVPGASPVSSAPAALSPSATAVSAAIAGSSARRVPNTSASVSLQSRLCKS